MTLFEVVRGSILILTLMGTFFWGKGLIFMDINLCARRLYIPFGPTKDDLRKMAQDKAEGVVGVGTILFGAVLQIISQDWQENYRYVVNPQLHIPNWAVYITCYTVIFFLLFWFAKYISGQYFRAALNERMKAIFEAHSNDNPTQAQTNILQSIKKLLDIDKADTETVQEFIRKVAGLVGYQLSQDSPYLQTGLSPESPKST